MRIVTVHDHGVVVHIKEANPFLHRRLVEPYRVGCRKPGIFTSVLEPSHRYALCTLFHTRPCKFSKLDVILLGEAPPEISEYSSSWATINTR